VYVLSILKKISEDFTAELTTAKKGIKTSLPFIVHQLSREPLVGENQTFLVLKIGGSILQKSRVAKVGNDIIIKTLEESKLPVMTTKDIFLSIIDKAIDPDMETVAINFAYPLKPVFQNGKLDGNLVMGTKEHAFKGMVGENLGETIENYIFSKYGRKIRVTICLTLAGLTKHEPLPVAGGVVGTGLNFAFFLDETHVVNLEAANFNKFEQSEEGKQIDAQSLTLGRSLYEKETAGGYLYHHLNILLAKNGIKHPSIHDTAQLDRLARGNIQNVSELARGLFEHSAALVSCEIAGITNFTKRNMTFVMEGSLFWVGWRYREMVESFVKDLTNHKVTFEEIKDCGIIGAAKLVT
jgi:hexokinase